MVNKLAITILAAAIFYIIANPYTYKLSRQVFGTWVASDTGCATFPGFILHTIIYGIITYGLMR